MLIAIPLKAINKNTETIFLLKNDNDITITEKFNYYSLEDIDKIN